ncbi:cadherin-23-like [Ruditapes philippinarum]|uniref:cadherin-23-like n=1 Tax=Ruditapes philippinarum TaxID=129788 RepID=UPI00295A840C|nr:cadherin-23-like [Ruditapes philippinarum]
MQLDSGGTLPCDGYFSVVEVADGFGRYHFNIYALRTNYSAEKSYTLEILANNTPSADPDDVTRISISQNVAINIRDLQNLPPTINKDKTAFNMLESLQPNEQLFGFIEANDQDVRDPHPIRYELVRPRLTDETAQEAYDMQYFRLGDVILDGILYKVPLILNNTIDREEVQDRTKTVYLGILAIEYDPLNRPNREKGTAYETISIQIFDVNDQRPMFSNDNYVVTTTELSGAPANPENFNPISNNVEIQVVDSDSDQYQKFNVSIISGNENNDFKLDNSDGSGLQLFNLYAKEKILDFEKPPNTYVLKLKAVDVQNPNFVSTATVTVSLVDANDHDPEFANETYFITIKESQPRGIIGAVTAMDRDSGSFGIISGYEIIGGDITKFSIDSNGRITLDELLDFESQEIHYITVAAYDSGIGNNRRVGSIQVIIQLINENDIGPEFDRTYSAILYEQSKDLIPDITVLARSRDASNPIIRYSIAGVEPAAVPISAFSIGSASGHLTVNQEIDYKQTAGSPIPGFVTVKVAADTGGLSSEISIAIEIINLNNFPPEFVPRVPNNIYKVEISELAVAGFTVIDLNVTDLDGQDNDNGIVTFQLQSGANDDFLLTGDSGIIKVTADAKLDIEENQPSYEIVVVATDKGTPPYSATATVQIILLDANNKRPVFVNALYRFQMRADYEVGEFIGQVGATDSDSNSQLVYSIDYTSVTFNRQSNNQDPIDATKIIKMNPGDGVINVAGRIERELYDRINLNVIVEDINIDATQARQFGTASVVIFILAAVDPSIYFTHGDWRKDRPIINLSFSESENINYQILSLKATDPSIPETIEDYREVESSDVEDYFSLKGPYLSVKKPFGLRSLPRQKGIGGFWFFSNKLKTQRKPQLYQRKD